MRGRRPIGRPSKYGQILRKLEDDDLYTPASVADFAIEKGFIEGEDAKALRLARQRVRIAMARWTDNKGFPDEGDGHVTLKGQAPTPGWFGWRWKAALD